ncbi:serpin family protein [Streptomyces sp. Je 1-369]|uniref:serpin family protein n=1 Tax=Streptomyces sp. Je 1-369 TaxID=2966192 RepID=UPI002AA29D71|nr:serpin family protein [Streptomyces sp. Je 1-369]
MSADRGTVFSAPGVWPLLAFLADGAAGAPRAELAEAVGLPADESASAARALLAAMDHVEGLDAALGLWTRRTLTLRDAWRDKVPVDALGVLTGDAATDAATLDGWAAARTGGLIERVPAELTPDTELVLASALALRADWGTPFEPQLLVPAAGPWRGRRIAGLQRSAPGLDAVRIGHGPAGRVTGVTLRGVPAGEGAGDVDVQLLLGEAHMAPGDVLTTGLGMLTDDTPTTSGDELAQGPAGPGAVLRETLADTRDEPPHVALSTVEFTLDAEHDLQAPPGVFGLAAASVPRPGSFPGISDRPLRVESARQTATATFGPTGFRAAAVTAVTMDWMGLPSYPTTELAVTVDRPFGFLAVHRTSRLVLAAGWVTDPKPYREDEDH